MLLKLPIILSSNSFYFDQLFPNYSQYKASYYITNLYCYVKNYNIIPYLYMKSKKDLWFSQLAKGIFNELRCYGYE